MAMGRTENIRPCCMNSAVDHVCRRIQQPAFPAINHLSTVIDLNQITLLDQAERHAKGVYPERSWVNGVAQGDMSSYALVETVLAKDTECRGEAALEVVALIVWGGEFGRTGEPRHLYFSLGFREAGFKRSEGRWLG